MQRICLLIPLIVCILLLLSSSVVADEGTLEYPVYMVDLYDPDGGCWRGMAPDGHWDPPVWVVPEKLLVGPPPSALSGVTFPTDHWVELMFSGRLVDGPGDDIIVIENGQCGEQALIFITDGAQQEYLLGIATAPNTNKDEPAPIGLDIGSLSLPFMPRAVRIVALDLGGASPGFDIAGVRARVSSNCTMQASRPYPPDGARRVLPDTVLRWSAGCLGDKHEVYFADTYSSVSGNAIPVALPPQPQDANSFGHRSLMLGRQYYWRVDEVSGADAQIKWPGDIWTFTVTDNILLDDFDSYSYPANPVFSTWRERGRAFVSIVDKPFLSCQQSLIFHYYYDSIYFSEALRTFASPQDWASAGVQVLELSFYGDAGNSTDGQMYVAIGDGNSQKEVLYDGDMNDISQERWHVWRADVKNISDVNMCSIKTLGIGFRSKSSVPGIYGTGQVFIEDIILRPAVCRQDARPAADVTADCVVDFEDFGELAYDWRQSVSRVFPVLAPKGPVAWYRFDGSADDSAGAFHGEVRGRATYAPGVYGQAISFDGKSASVGIPAAASLFATISKAITICFWQYGQQSSHLHDSVCSSNYTYGVSNPAIAVNLGCWQLPGRFSWDCGYPWSFDNRLTGHHRRAGEWSGRWNHWAFTKDTQFNNGQGRMQIFLNGTLYAVRTGSTSPISGVTSFEIGSGWYGGYDGLIDDLRIYDYALSQPEVAYVATTGSGVFPKQIPSPADLDANKQVDLRDLAVLANDWLDNTLWP